MKPARLPRKTIFAALVSLAGLTLIACEILVIFSREFAGGTARPEAFYTLVIGVLCFLLGMLSLAVMAPSKG